MSCPWPEAVVGINDFCEAIDTCGFILQPLATAAALAFIPAALVIARRANRRSMHALHLLTFTAAAMGVGTVAQHATGTWTGMMLDHAGMQSGNVAMVLVGLRRWTRWEWGTLLGGGAVAFAAVLVATAAYPDVRRALMIGGMVPCALIELRLWFRDGSTTSYRWFGAGWAAFLLAVAAWKLDQTALCRPQSWLQLHAVWHLLAAAGLVSWAYYYSQFSSLNPGRSDA